LPIKEERMLKATLAVKVAAGVLGGVLLTGGGIALATDTHPTFRQPSLDNTDQPSGQPGTTCAADDQDEQGAVGTNGPDVEGSGEAGDHNEQGTKGPDAEATGEAGDQNEQGEDCDQDGDQRNATEGPETEQSEGSHGDQTGGSDHQGQGGDEAHSTPEPSSGAGNGSHG
jgi:hypothetical protein